MHALISTLLLTCLFHINLAHSENEWHRGEIVLATGEVLSGQLNYTEDGVQCNINNRIRAFSTFQVSQFNFYDPSLNVNRTFIPVDIHMARNVKKSAFYELVSEGSITLLRKEVHTYKLANDPYQERDLAWETRTVQRFQHDVHMRVKDFEYYYVHNGNFHQLNNFRKEIHPLLQRHQAAITHFIEKNSLNTREIESQIRIIDLYNRLCEENNVAYRQK